MKPSFEELLSKIETENDPEHMKKSLTGSGIKNAIAQRKLRKDRQNELSTPPLKFEDEPTITYNLRNQEEYELAKPLVDRTVEEFKKKQEQRRREIADEMRRKSFEGVNDIRRYLTQNL